MVFLAWLKAVGQAALSQAKLGPIRPGQAKAHGLNTALAQHEILESQSQQLRSQAVSSIYSFHTTNRLCYYSVCGSMPSTVHSFP